MKFLIDACAGGRITSWLSQLGHDVLEVRGKNMAMPDTEVIRWAMNDGRIVVTIDKDFGEILFAQENYKCSVIRLPDVPIESRKAILNSIVVKYEKFLEQNNCVITATKKRIRMKKL